MVYLEHYLNNNTNTTSNNSLFLEFHKSMRKTTIL